jgi:hypothetical protein
VSSTGSRELQVFLHVPYMPIDLVNDSQNLAFTTSHFVIDLLPFDYLSNQKQ